MIGMDWQNLMVLALVVAACAYLVYRASKLFRRRSTAGCSVGCAQCPTTNSPSTAQTAADVTIEQLAGSAKRVKTSPKS